MGNILIVGGSRGIGYSTAKLLSDKHNVFVASRTKGQAEALPESNSSQSEISELVGNEGAKTQFEFSPFTFKASNTTSPLENWNLTVRSKSTAATVNVFNPSTNSVRFPK